MTDVQSATPRPRRLRVGRTVIAAFQYCFRDFRRLVAVTWFACVLVSATRLLLDWLMFPWPSKLPDWMLSDFFDPPTWLMAFALTPWLAMGWAFVLNEMFEEDARRGLVTMRSRELPWLRFELSRPILLAAAILTVTNLIEAATRFVQSHILDAILARFEPTEIVLTMLVALITAFRVGLMVAVFVWCYLLAGMVLRDGTFSVARLRQVMRGNWLRVGLIFLILSIILRGLYRLIEPATLWLTARITDLSHWTLEAALIRFVVDFPFQLLWIVSWAVIIGIVLHTLDPPARATGGAGEHSA